MTRRVWQRLEAKQIHARRQTGKHLISGGVPCIIAGVRPPYTMPV